MAFCLSFTRSGLIFCTGILYILLVKNFTQTAIFLAFLLRKQHWKSNHFLRVKPKSNWICEANFFSFSLFIDLVSLSHRFINTDFGTVRLFYYYILDIIFLRIFFGVRFWFAGVLLGKKLFSVTGQDSSETLPIYNEVAKNIWELWACNCVCVWEGGAAFLVLTLLAQEFCLSFIKLFYGVIFRMRDSKGLCIKVYVWLLSAGFMVFMSVIIRLWLLNFCGRRLFVMHCTLQAKGGQNIKVILFSLQKCYQTFCLLTSHFDGG